MKFALSYSGGKDSILALYRAMKLGHEPAALITTYNEKRQNSHFHGIPFALLSQAAESLGIPLILIKTEGARYAPDFEACLAGLREQGVEMCVFGDIDLEEHFAWCHERCVKAGIQSFFPLRGEGRRALVEEFISSGFRSLITVVDLERMNEAYLGQVLSLEVIDGLEADGVDACGENGEYHSFVFDGPIFKSPIPFTQGAIARNGHYAFLPLAGVSVSSGEAGGEIQPDGQTSAAARDDVKPIAAINLENSYRFFRNTDCQYFPCHKNPDPGRFNCLFCYCPLYLLGDKCGGNFRFVGADNRIKDCTLCNLPHQPEYYEEILKRLREASQP